MASKEKIKKKLPKVAISIKPKEKKVEVPPKEETRDPLKVISAPEENILDSTDKDNENTGESTAKYKKAKKRSQSKEKGTREVESGSKKEETETKDETILAVSTPKEKRRSPSPFGKNSVEPVKDGQAGTSNQMGSSSSLRSNLSAREAWTDRSESGTPTEKAEKKKTRRSSAVSVLSISSVDKNKQENSDIVSIKSAATLEREAKEQHAYIPYLYARDYLVHVVDDMKDMKTNHIRIVHDIESYYKAIEDETQSQFNLFVICLRHQYSDKVKTFRQVIDIHRHELEKKETYYKELINSLMERNKRLLQDKKILLVKNKVEIDRVEKEKGEIARQMTLLVDKANASATTAGKEQVSKFEQLEKEKQTLLEQKSEMQVLLTEKEEKLHELETALSQASVVPIPIVKETREVLSAEKKTETSTAVLVGAVALGEQEREQQEEERHDMQNEREELTQERQLMEESRNSFDEERKTWMEEISRLQTDVAQLTQESAEWKASFESMKSQAEDNASLCSQYRVLEDQYKALSLIVVSSEASKAAAEENITKVNEEKTMMAEEKKRLEADIKNWEADFKKKNGRAPTEDDKPDSAKEMYTQFGEVELMVSSLDNKIDTLEHVKSGDVPPPPKAAPMPVAVPDPQVVEVKVPDPTVLAALEKSQAELSALQLQMSNIQQEKSDLHEKISQLNSDLSESRLRINELEAELSNLPAHGDTVDSVVVMSSQSEEKVVELITVLEEKDNELERLRKDNLDMQKDMKKMIRKYEKVEAKMKKLSEFKQAQILLEAVVALAHEVHREVPDAAENVNKRHAQAGEELTNLKDSKLKAQKNIDNWEQKFKKKLKREASEKDRDDEVSKLYRSLEDLSQEQEEKNISLQAINLLQTGVVKTTETKQQRPQSAQISATPVEDVDQQLSVLDEKVIDLETENEALKGDKQRLEDKIKNLEEKVKDLHEQVVAGASIETIAQDSKEISLEVLALQKEIDGLNANLHKVGAELDEARDERDEAKTQVIAVNEQLANERTELEGKINKFKKMLEAKVKSLEEELASTKKRLEEVEAARLANVPLDTAKEIKNLQKKIALLEKEKSGSGTATAGLQAQISELENKLVVVQKHLETQKNANKELDLKAKAAKSEKEKAIRDLTNQLQKKEEQRASLETKLMNAQLGKQKVGAVVIPTKAGAADTKAMKDQLSTMKKENTELNMKIKHLEREARQGGAGGGDAAADKNLIKRHEKILKELEKKYEMEKAKNEKLFANFKTADEELKQALKTVDQQVSEIRKLQAELSALGVAAKEGVEAASKVKYLEKEVKKLTEENKVLVENFNSERVLRKKYYNMVEDMKGKIRVYCRVRPLVSSERERGNVSVLKSPDEYTVQVQSSRGLKEFQYDQIFMEDASQEKVFTDVDTLIQSAVDGYNVCIFAYGQTGSGKTFTMIGDQEQNHPGIAPRAFQRIFQLAEDNKSKFKTSISVYMLELYNDKLIDLFAKPGSYDDERLDIKKDQKGMVFIQGAAVKIATNTKELFALFEDGSKNRHTASTMMNSESSRSHLILGIVMESTNKLTGQVLKGKLSLVDLAGSERVAKTQAGAEQLKEAMSINKSLSALGDVISALSSEQSFIPYRNNKLTMLMQDSLGGNAKTLMFVNVSPADYNTDETVVSLTYASRVKLITNDATKNAENKEIARLKAIIQKLKKGDAVDEDV
ncbi:COP1-interactive protein 1-like [Gigantopelta aegis]|uniref:COP1-interactive protein 1-like n=1 Tax=Gigantopelta aegis TaxID=1735272 RepID=UPI001B888358|nr:COP1-interactive protein 1-like [Gigantopelta aegis]